MPLRSDPYPEDDILEQHLSLLEILFGRVPVGIAILDRALTVRRCNPTWASFIERHTATPSARVVPGARFVDLVPGSEDSSIVRYQRALAGETVREDGVEMSSNGNVSYWDVVIAPLIRDGAVVGVVDVTVSATERMQALAEARAQREQLERLIEDRTGALQNANRLLLNQIQERTQAEEELLEERNFTEAILETAGALVVVFDREGRIVRFNRACERLTGYSFAEVRGRRFWEFLVLPEETDTLVSGFRSFMSGGPVRGGEAHWRTKSGGRRLIVWSNAALTGQDGEVKYLIGTGIDITDRKQAEEALRASEEKYRDLVQNANSIILRMDTSGRITFFNEYAQRFFGFSEPEILGRRVVGSIVPPSDSAGRDLAQMIEEIGARPDRYATNENENIRHDGERVWVAWTNRAILDEEGHTKEVLCVGNDITERRLAEEALRRAHEELEDRVEERTSQLVQANEVLQQEIAERQRIEAVLRERITFENLVTTISTKFINLPPEELDNGINQALKTVGEFASVDRSYVFMYSDDGRYFSNTHEWCAPGIDPEIHNLQGLPSESIPAWTRTHQQGEVIDILQVASLPPEWAAERALLQPQGIQSLVSVPLVYGGKTLGFLGFDSVRIEKQWADEIVTLLRIVGEIFVNAIERTRAARALQEANQTLEERVADRTAELYTLMSVQQAISSHLTRDDMLQLVADEARRLTASELALVMLAEDKSRMRIAVVSGGSDTDLRGATIPIEGSLAGLALRSGKPQSTADARVDPRPDAAMVERAGTRSMLMVPLVYGDRATGVIALANKAGGPYGPEDERRLAMLATGAAVDLENARLYQQEQERREEAEQRRKVAEGLREILAVLNSDRPLQVVLEYIVAQACRLLGTDAGALYRLEPDGITLAIQAAQGLPEQYVAEVTVPVGRGAVGRAVLERRPVAIDDLRLTLAQDTQLVAGVRGKHLEALVSRYRAILAVPLVVKDQVYGGIVLHYPSARTFSNEEIALAATFGDQAALAIENARLRSRAEQAAVAAERSRLARDLHDAVTQTLFSSSLIAEVLPRLWERNPDEGRRRLEELRQLTRGALAEMRTLLLELRPSALTEAALPELLRQLAEALTGRARVPAHVNIEGDCAVPPDVQVALYRIAQEALNNVAKHSGATLATLDLQCSPEGVTLTVSDDGRGFDSRLVGPDHLGLGIMRERAETIGAALSVASVPGQGTQVVVVWQARLRDEMK